MQKFDYHWRKAVNVPAWVIHFLVCIIYIGISAYTIAVFQKHLKGSVDNTVASAFAAASGINIGIALLTIVFDVIEIVLIAKTVMKPAVYLSFACIKSLIWIILFGLACVSIAPAGILLTLAVAATSVAQLIYGAIVVHRNRKGTLIRGGKYAPASTGHVEGNLYNPSAQQQQQPHHGQQTQGFENLSTAPHAPAGAYGQNPYGSANANTEYKSPVPSPQPPQQYGAYAAPNQGYYAPQQQHQPPPPQQQQPQQQQQQQYYSGGAPAPAGSYELGDR
ncbi:regulatory factor X [Microdochium nivale]|nr:regulatory factor X [Microdochium nivale]